VSADTHMDALSVLCRMDAARLKALAEQILPDLEPLGIEVQRNRTALSMLPMKDTAQGSTFYLGEVLVAEAWVRVGEAQGYAAVTGRDLEQALAAALLDAAGRLPEWWSWVEALVNAERDRQAAEDTLTLREIGATRAVMETF
jgi:alpha-D-ribose 1-methylphosphonate 5-triphosphate synthase subunit PhnG